MERCHHHLLLAVLLIFVAVGDSMLVCDPAALASQVLSFCTADTLGFDCCVAVLSCINMDSATNHPCLCRLEDEPDFIASGLSVWDIADLYDSCKGRQGLAHKVASACAPMKNISAPPQQHVKVIA